MTRARAAAAAAAALGAAVAADWGEAAAAVGAASSWRCCRTRSARAGSRASDASVLPRPMPPLLLPSNRARSLYFARTLFLMSSCLCVRAIPPPPPFSPSNPVAPPRILFGMQLPLRGLARGARARACPISAAKADHRLEMPHTQQQRLRTAPLTKTHAHTHPHMFPLSRRSLSFTHCCWFDACLFLPSLHFPQSFPPPPSSPSSK